VGIMKKKKENGVGKELCAVFLLVGGGCG